MNRNVRFNRWRIALKTIKWWGVLCVFTYPLATILQAHVLHFQYLNDAYGYALRKKENFICLGLSAVFLLLTFAVF